MQTDRARDDAALVSRVATAGTAQGAEEALEELYRRYAPRVYSFGVRVLGRRDLAEELVQETFVRLWRTAGSFDQRRGSVGAFVFTIARNIAVDLWRRPSSRPFDPEPEELAEPVDRADRIVTVLAVRDALRSLSVAHREVLELTYRGGLKQTEIAEILGVPLGTVKTRTYYALRALRLALQERGLDD
jgi:RNA polymerase sigma-70 factor (ECF subfamily)